MITLHMVKDKKKTDNMINKGLVFSIQSYSVHDGPGMRTTVFLNGCPLSCLWCCNPEGLSHKPILLHSSVKCKKCGKCVDACNKGGLNFIDGEIIFNREICNQCESMECVEECLYEGNSIVGEYYSVDKLMNRFQRERHFWGDKGGVTFSGGEPLLQKNFILNLLKRCKESYIHTCIETTACVSSDFFMEIIKYIDWMFVDIKHMDPQEHKKMCGTDNTLIIKNLKLLSKADWWDGFIVLRIPIIPSFNDSEENIRETARFVKELDFEVINILPFHRFGESKYRQLGQNYEMIDLPSPSKEHMNNLKKIIEDEGLICFVGHDTPF